MCTWPLTTVYIVPRCFPPDALDSILSQHFAANTTTLAISCLVQKFMLKMKSELLTSCDTFVAMSNVTGSKKVIFGKNSDRPSGEVSGMKNKLVIDLEAINIISYLRCKRSFT